MTPDTSQKRFSLHAAWRFRMQHTSLRAILLLWFPAVLIAGSVLLPIGYLVVRVLDSDKALFELFFRASNFEILRNTLLLALGVTTASAGIAVPIAWLTTRTDLPFKRVWGVLGALPLVMPSYVGAYLLVSMFGPVGILQGWLETAFGVTRLPSMYGFWGALFVLTLLSYPYTLLSVRATLLAMNPSLEEAARSLGLTPWQTFWKVTFPQMRAGLVAGSLLVSLYVLRDFGAVSFMRYDTFTRAIYVQYQSMFDRSGAAALALVLVLITVGILIAEYRFSQKNPYHGAATLPPRPANVITLGRWKWLALAFLGTVTSLGVFIPAGVLLFWLGRGLQAGERLSSLVPAVQNSLTGSALAAIITLIVCIPVVVLDVRRSNRFTAILERISYIGFALPGVAVALSLVFFGANFARGIYQTLPLLIFAYVVLFLPQAIGATRSALLQVHPNLEEAGRSLGRHPLDVFRRVTLKLIRPGMGAGAALVFLTTMKELPATLILGPYGFNTLATSVWSAISEAYFAKAAAPALLLLMTSSIPMAFLLFRNTKR